MFGAASVQPEGDKRRQFMINASQCHCNSKVCNHGAFSNGQKGTTSAAGNARDAIIAVTSAAGSLVHVIVGRAGVERNGHQDSNEKKHADYLEVHVLGFVIDPRGGGVVNF